MYKTFRVKNFRCFKDLQINDLGRVNLIAGKNNTGKTALLEAMYLHTRPLSPDVIFDLQDVRGMKRPDGYLTNYWRQLFYYFDSSLTIEFMASTDTEPDCHNLKITEFPNDRSTNSYIHSWYRDLYVNRVHRDISPTRIADSVDVFLRFSLGDNSHLTSGQDVLVASDPEVRIYPIHEYNLDSLNVPTQGRPNEGSIRRRFSQIDSAGGLLYVLEILRTLEPRLQDLRLTEPYGVSMLAGRLDGKLIPLRLMGDGLNSVCHFIMTMKAENVDYLFIDEIENGIHYSVQAKVWKAIGQVARELDIQIFATTHSLEMIRAAYEAFKDDDPFEFRYHRLDRKSDGDIEAVTYNKFGMDAVSAFDFEYEVRG